MYKVYTLVSWMHTMFHSASLYWVHGTAPLYSQSCSSHGSMQTLFFPAVLSSGAVSVGLIGWKLMNNRLYKSKLCDSLESLELYLLYFSVWHLLCESIYGQSRKIIQH